MRATRRDAGPAARRGQRGVVLFAVLTGVVLLGLVQGGMLIAAQTALRRAEVHAGRVALRAAAEAVLWAAVHELANANQDGRAPRLPAEQVFEGVPVRLSVEDEGGKVDLNRASAAMIAAAFATGGCAPLVCEQAASAVVAWRTRLPNGEGRLLSLAALAEVPGVPPGLAARAAPALTVHSLQERPDQAAAPPPLRATLALEAAAPRPGGPGGGAVYTLRAEAARRDGLLHAVEATIRVQAPVAVLAWR